MRLVQLYMYKLSAPRPCARSSQGKCAVKIIVHCTVLVLCVGVVQVHVMYLRYVDLRDDVEYSNRHDSRRFNVARYIVLYSTLYCSCRIL